MAATPAFAVGIATVTNVVNDGFRQPPGGEERRAATSDELVSDEALRTARDSSIAVKFVDGSELSVEAQSEVVLSDYLFDPQASAATGTIKLNAGLFHFNSNNTPDENLVLQTPVATIGIRGTQFLVTVANDVTIVDILDGAVEVKPTGGGKPITCEGGQSILVESAKSDAICGDLGSFSTAAAPPAEADLSHDNADRSRDFSAPDGRPDTDKPETPDKPDKPDKPGDPGGDPGGDPDPDHSGNHSGHGDGSNPGKGHANGHSNGGHNNGGTDNPGGGGK
jgi:FecR-like protein